MNQSSRHTLANAARARQLKFSEWCDRMKTNHAFCVDEKMTESDYVTDLFVSYFMQARGCSWITALGHAEVHIDETYRRATGHPIHPPSTYIERPD